QYGLYDMHGNVWEWVQDAYQKDLSQMPVTDPVVTSGPYRVIRGGSWGNLAHYLRSAIRNGNSPGKRGNLLGFRLVRTISR
ncbi:MAG: formylglycine-generating enzyme family protein, partial [Bdellovibrionales bacterium]